jgi:hypothetical protein
MIAAASDSLEVLLQFAFLAVLYLFLLWVVSSALRDMRRPTANADELTPFPGSGEPRRAWLVVKGGGGLSQGDSFELDGELTIGRSSASSVEITDSFASGKHARVHRRGENVVLQDLGSTNGTYLNGERVDGETELRPLDVIRIGDTEFRFEE